VKKGDKCPECGARVEVSRSIEVANTFPLGTWYAEKMGAYFIDSGGNSRPFWFASYGIGTSRLVGTLVEVFHDEHGIMWPETVAPFRFHLINLARTSDGANDVYKTLTTRGISVLYDDRADISSGEKLAEADLLGVPFRIVVSEKTIQQGGVEIKRRSETEAKIVTIDKVLEIHPQI
jgi:prolyl-tRNA synthetase